MAAPDHVPTREPLEKHYTSPPQRTRGWQPDRPGDVIAAGDPHVDAMGAQGPDQGYVLTLTHLFDDKLHLAAGEHRSDVDAGCVAVALKRASLFGRAPVVHDLRIAYTLFGFLEPHPPVDLIEFRRELFAEVHYPFHYFERRAIADLVPDEVLHQTPDEVTPRFRADWRDQLDL